MEILRIYPEERFLIKYYAIKHLILLKIENITVIKDVLLQCFINVLIRTLLVVKSEIMPNQELAKELHKPIIIEFVKRKVHSFFIDNVWGADLADMQLISKFNKEF